MVPIPRLYGKTHKKPEGAMKEAIMDMDEVRAYRPKQGRRSRNRLYRSTPQRTSPALTEEGAQQRHSSSRALLAGKDGASTASLKRNYKTTKKLNIRGANKKGEAPAAAKKS
jgi:hypothetical protein